MKKTFVSSKKNRKGRVRSKTLKYNVVPNTIHKTRRRGWRPQSKDTKTYERT